MFHSSNLSSINLANHVTEQGIDTTKLRNTIRVAMRALDNVIDLNFYPIPQALNSNMKHRPVGLGLMGFQDALYKMNIPYASDDAIRFADTSMELISYYAIEASADLAQEKGHYDSFEGSLWSKGILPIDSLEQCTGAHLVKDTVSYCGLDWESLRQKVRRGMRNSNCMAIAPTASISNICGVTQSIEPSYQNLFVKSNLSGEFVLINPYLVDTLKSYGLWDSDMLNRLKHSDGSVQEIDELPMRVKNLFATAFEIDPTILIKCAARRQKWIDQSQSLNIYVKNPNGKLLDSIYMMAWEYGLKSTYYLRSIGATNVTKHTATNVTKHTMAKVCSIDNPDCESCQ